MSRFWVASVHRVFLFLAICHLAASLAFSGTPPKRRHRRVVKPAAHRTATARVAKTGAVQPVAFKKTTATRVAAPVIAGGPWTSPTYADSTDGDNIDGEDLDVRRAAVEALGSYNGSRGCRWGWRCGPLIQNTAPGGLPTLRVPQDRETFRPRFWRISSAISTERTRFPFNTLCKCGWLMPDSFDQTAFGHFPAANSPAEAIEE